jgi:signal transduction histidine kinase
VERGVLIGAAWLRWAAWVWLAVVALVNLHRVDHPSVALAAVAATGVVTLAAHGALRGGQWRRAVGSPLVAAEVGVAVAVVVADGWVRQGRITGQTLAGSWPIPAILVATVAGGLLWGVGVGGLLTAARGLAAAIGGTAPGQGGRQAVSVISTGVSWIAFGVAVGIVINILRSAQRDLADAESRERIARDLHDGVLQTLSLIERRSPSAEIARLARDQERDLRAYLFGDHERPGTIAAELRSVVARFERSWPGCEATVTTTDDVPSMGPDAVKAVGGAVLEALTNSAKHGGARRVVVFADLDEQSGGLFVSVKDDGTGFDPQQIEERVGMSRSIRGRVEGVGGRVRYISSPGDGAEVAMVIPLSQPVSNR